MATKAKTTPAATPKAINEQLERMAAFNGEAMSAYAQACQAYAKCLTSLNSELMSFVNTRLDRDAELGQALSRCESWSDAVDLQQQWAQRATQEYLVEAGRLTELASKIAKESWEPVYETAGRMMSETQKTAQ